MKGILYGRKEHGDPFFLCTCQVYPYVLVVSILEYLVLNNSASLDVWRRRLMGGGIPTRPLPEIGKASRFGDPTIGIAATTRPEAVLNQEHTVYARYAKGAILPAHARGCFEF